MIFKLQKFKVEKRGKNTPRRRDDFFLKNIAKSMAEKR